MKKNYLALHRKLEKGEYVVTTPLGAVKIIKHLGDDVYRVKALGGSKWNLSIKLMKKIIEKKDWLKEKNAYKKFAKNKTKKPINKIPPKRK